MAHLRVQARPASIQASSPLLQVKAAVAQVGDCDWIKREKILCSTMGVS